MIHHDRIIGLCIGTLASIFCKSLFAVKTAKKVITSYWFWEKGISRASEQYKIDPKWLGGSVMLI